MSKATRASWGKVRKLPSGRYQASYVGPDGQRYPGPMTYGSPASVPTSPPDGGHLER